MCKSASNCRRSGFTGTNTNNLFQVHHEDLSIADFAGAGRFGDRLNDLIKHAVINGHFNPAIPERQKLIHDVRLGIQQQPFCNLYHYAAATG